jgi:hypothetical protein
MPKATGFCIVFCHPGKPRFGRVGMAGFQRGFGIGALPLTGRASFRHRGGIRVSDLDTGIMLPVRWTRRAAPADPRTGRRSPPRPAGAFGAARLRRRRRTSPRPGRRAWSTRLLALFPIRAPRRKYASSDVLAFGTLAAGQAVAWAIPRMGCFTQRYVKRHRSTQKSAEIRQLCSSPRLASRFPPDFREGAARRRRSNSALNWCRCGTAGFKPGVSGKPMKIISQNSVRKRRGAE